MEIDKIMKKNILLVDIGSNSIIGTLLSYRNNKIKIYFDTAYVTGLAKNIKKTGCLNPHGITKTLSSIKTLIGNANRILEKRNIFVFGTEALRIADDREYFISRLWQEMGLKVDVISGLKEAEYLYKAGTLLYDPDILIDLGGASTEFVFINKTTGNVLCESFPIGARVFRDTGLGALREFLLKKSISMAKTCKLILTGGTISAYAAAYLGLSSFSQERTEGFKFTRQELDKFYMDIKSGKLNLDRILSFDRGRKETFLDGLMLLSDILKIIEADSGVVSNLGARFGYFADKLGISKIDKILWPS